MNKIKTNMLDFWRTNLRVVALVILIAMALVTLTVLGAPASAQDGTAGNNSLPNIVLVHGSWADGSGWNDVIQRLQQRGFHVTAVQIPLTSLAEDVARTRAVLAEQDGPTILVAHSYGGAVISQLGADAPNVIGLIYVAGFAPDEGETINDLVAQAPPTPALAAIYPDSTGYLWLTREGFEQHFASGVNSKQARVLAAGQKPVNAAGFGETYGPPAWRSLPSWYLLTENDQVVHPDLQHFFAQRMGATVSTVDSGHLAMISHANKVVRLITDVSRQLSN